MFRADLDAIYAGEPVTIVNKLDARDAEAQQDAYYVTVLQGCVWTESQVRTVQSDGTVTIGTVHRVQVPETSGYKAYREWKADPADGFTVRGGDFVVRGTLSDAVDASNVRTLVARYEPDAFQVQAFRDLSVPNLKSPSKGVLRLAEGLFMEG